MTLPSHELLLLWDVDHTLIENGGVSKENYALAFELLTGRPAGEQPQTDGRTDVGIMENLLCANGEDPAVYPLEAQWAALIEAGERNESELSTRGHALIGANAALERVAAQPGVIQSVLTGNIEANARVKLGAFDLDRWIDFSVGGFGAESRVRAELVPVAQRKAADLYGFDASLHATVLVGDTARDVQAGLDGGARVIGIATGVSSVDELVEAGAHAVLSDLSDVEAFVTALTRVSQLGPARQSTGA